MNVEKHKAPIAMRGPVVPVQMSDFDGSGQIEGMASVYGVPIDRFFGQVILEPGIFAESIARNGAENIRVLWQHNPDEPIGNHLSVTETEKGVPVKQKLLIDDVRRAREAYALAKHKAIGGFSIGFGVEESFTDNKTGMVHYTKGELWEVSLVTFPANSQATIDKVHSMGLDAFKDIRELEKFLREAGLSRNAAKAVASHGFEGLSQREAEEFSPELIEALQNLHQEIRKGIQ